MKSCSIFCYIADKLPLFMGLGQRILGYYIESSKMIVNLYAAYSLIFSSDSGTSSLDAGESCFHVLFGETLILLGLWDKIWIS